MWLILREAFGWALVVLGLVMIGFVFVMAINRSVLEAIAVSIPATVVFRSGIGLVKLAFASRIASAIATDSK